MTESDNNSVKNEIEMIELNSFIAKLKVKDKNKVLQIFDYLKNNSSITSTEAKALLNVSESTYRRLLIKCESKGFLNSVGQTRNRKYYLATK